MKIMRNGKIGRLAAGVQTGGNLAKLKRIKVNQGEIFFNENERVGVRVIVGTGRPHPDGCRTRWWAHALIER